MQAHVVRSAGLINAAKGPCRARHARSTVLRVPMQTFDRNTSRTEKRGVVKLFDSKCQFLSKLGVLPTHPLGAYNSTHPLNIGVFAHSGTSAVVSACRARGCSGGNMWVIAPLSTPAYAMCALRAWRAHANDSPTHARFRRGMNRTGALNCAPLAYRHIVCKGAYMSR